MFITTSLLIVSVALLGLYWVLKSHFSYWRVRGFPYIQNFMEANSFEMLLMKIGPSHYFLKVYNSYKDLPYVGIFILNAPKLIVNDLDVMKKVLVQDWHKFPSRNEVVDQVLDPLFGKSILMLSGERWKQVREVMTPMFTTGKMKRMLEHVDKCGRDLAQYLEVISLQGHACKTKDTATRYTSQVIASCILGVEVFNFDGGGSSLMHYMKRSVEMTVYQEVTLLLMATVPRLQQFLRMRAIDVETTEFYRNIVWETVRYREKHNIMRNDLLQSLMDLRKEDTDGSLEMDGDDFVAQIGAMLVAGFETTASTLTFGLYELARYPDIQEKARSEMRKHGDGEVTYDAIQSMKYLHKVVSEMLRKYPILGFLDRTCVEDYSLPDPTGKGFLTLPSGTGIFISILGLHYDPRYYPDPETFDPERFSEENIQSRPNLAYLPFGSGPRVCIGLRFAFMQIKTALIHILTQFQVNPCEDTPREIVYDPKSFLLRPLKEIPLRFVKL